MTKSSRNRRKERRAHKSWMRACEKITGVKLTPFKKEDFVSMENKRISGWYDEETETYNIDIK